MIDIERWLQQQDDELLYTPDMREDGTLEESLPLLYQVTAQDVADARLAVPDIVFSLFHIEERHRDADHGLPDRPV